MKGIKMISIVLINIINEWNQNEFHYSSNLLIVFYYQNRSSLSLHVAAPAAGGLRSLLAG